MPCVSVFVNVSGFMKCLAFLASQIVSMNNNFEVKVIRDNQSVIQINTFKIEKFGNARSLNSSRNVS